MDIERPITHQYEDPLSLVWIQTARRLGMQIHRSDEVYASWDGANCLTIGTAETLDADDNLAQMILHECCHALVQGPSNRPKIDWGLCNTDARDLEAEHACLRLQAKLTAPWGLRGFLAATTQWRAYYDNLAEDPLSPSDAPACRRAREGWLRSRQPSWRDPLEAAFAATAKIAEAVRPLLTTTDNGLTSLWSCTVPSAADRDDDQSLG